MFLVGRTVLANSAHRTTLRSKREFRWIGPAEPVVFEFIQLLCSYGCCKREFRWIVPAETVVFEFIQILCSYGCCKRESRWIGLAEPVVLESIQIVDCVNTVAEMHTHAEARVVPITSELILYEVL